MSQSPIPNILRPRQLEPIGWDFEEIRYREEPVPDAWWFIPWVNTQYCEIDEKSPYPKKPKSLLYYETKGVGHYRGSGMVIEETEGKVIGCYKVRADTEDGDDIREELEELKEEFRTAKAKQAPIERVDKPKSKMKAGRSTGLADAHYQNSLRLGGNKYDGKPLTLPNEIRRLNGLLLDPRPARIALHKEEAFRVHPDMAGWSFKKYGSQYPQLEYRIRNAMKDTFDKKFDLPLYRQKQIKAAEEAGHPEVEFTEEQSSDSEEEGETDFQDMLEEDGISNGSDELDGEEVIEETDDEFQGVESD